MIGNPRCTSIIAALRIFAIAWKPWRILSFMRSSILHRFIFTNQRRNMTDWKLLLHNRKVGNPFITNGERQSKPVVKWRIFDFQTFDVSVVIRQQYVSNFTAPSFGQRDDETVRLKRRYNIFNSASERLFNWSRNYFNRLLNLYKTNICSRKYITAV